MGFLSDLLGTKNEFQADPSKLLNPVNQSQVQQAMRGTQGGIGQQQDFVNALAAQGGLGNQSNVFAQQQALANTLGQQAQGIGPNVAQNQLNQATAQNIAQQGALMASQRGAGANAGMLARQAAQQGGNIQQQASGQAATLGAQQQLAAQQALMQQQNAMQGVAGQQVGQQANALQGLGQQQAQNQQMLMQGAQAQNQNQLGMQGINAGVAQGNAATNANLVGGVLSGASAALGMAEGGQVQPMQYSGGSQEDRQKRAQSAQSGVMKAAADNPVSKAIAWLSKADGGLIKGQALVPGDSLKNDTVPTMLSPGEVVIPRHVMESDNPSKMAAEFVKQVMAKKKVEPRQNLAEGGFTQPPQPSKVGWYDLTPVADEVPLYDPETNQPVLPAQDLMPEQAPPQVPPQEPMQSIESGIAPSAPSAVMGSGSGLLEQGLRGEAKAEGALGKQQADILQQGLEQSKAAQAEQQAEMATIQGRRAALQKEYEAGTVDPNRLVHNMGTGQRIATAIGLIMGGIGAGLTHGENPALKYLNQQIENDIKSQEADLGKKKSLLSETMQDMGNLKDARMMTEAQIRDGVAINMQIAAAKAKDPIAKARILQELGKFQMQTEAKLAPLKLKEAAKAAFKSGQLPPEQAINVIVDEKDRDEARKELSNINYFKTASRNVDALIKKAEGIGGISGNLPFSQTKGNFGSIRAQLSNTLRQMNKGNGVLSDKDAADVIDPLLPNPGDTKAQVRIKAQGIKSLMKNKLFAGSPVLDGYGLGVDASPLNPQEKAYAEWARQNPNDPRSAVVLKKLGME